MSDQQSHPEKSDDVEGVAESLPQRVPEAEQSDNVDTAEVTEGNQNHTQGNTGEDIKASANGYSAPPSALQFPKPSLEDITEENEGDGTQETEEQDNNGHHSPNGYSEHASPYTSRRPSAKPKSRAGIGSRGRWTQDIPASTDSLPNTDSTIYSPGGRSMGYEFDSPDHWTAPIGSPIRSQWSSPIASPICEGIETENRSRSRVQVKDHGPVAKWLAKRTKKSKSAPEKSTKPQARARGKKSGSVRSQYAPYIQPKINSFNPDYQPAKAELIPIMSEKLKWEAKPLVSTHNEYFKASQEKKPFKVLNEKLHWDPATKVDVWNRDYTPATLKPFKIFNEKLKWNQLSKIDNQAEDYARPLGQSEIFHESPNWRAQPKVITYNNRYVKPQGSSSTVFHESPQWKAQAKVDNVRPFYKPSGGGHIRVKTDRLNWKSGSKIDTFNPMYENIKSTPQPFKTGNLYNTNAKVDNGPGKDANGWSSHSSDTETEWLSMSPGGSEKLSPKFKTRKNNVTDRSKSQQEHTSYTPADLDWSSRKVLFHSKDIVDDIDETTRAYPFYKPTSNDTSDQMKKKPVFTTNKPEKRKDPKPDKSKKLFKERVDPLPPIGTYTHKADEPVVYPEGGAYYGSNRGNNANASRSQKIELIEMKDLSLLSKRGRQSVFIN